MPPCCLFSKHAPGHNRTHTRLLHWHTNIQRHDPHTDKRGKTHSHTHTYKCIVRAFTHPAWRTSFDLVIFLSLADNQQAMWLARPVCCAGAGSGSVSADGDGDGALHVALLAGWPNRSGLLFSSLSFFAVWFSFLFCQQYLFGHCSFCCCRSCYSCCG